MLSYDLDFSCEEHSPDTEMSQIYQAIVLGIRDYVAKNSLKKVCLGLSGGIDSALVATLAADAVGPENVVAFLMPGKCSSAHSLSDSDALVANLGIKASTISIKFLQSNLDMTLKPVFAGLEADVTEENIQARLRGLLLMANSNKFGFMLLATGNKSELSVGYSTLYGDMCGALAPIGDLYKTQVYALAKYINQKQERIPKNIIEKAPSAELRPGQVDQDSLPPYELLDKMLYNFTEAEMSRLECENALKAESIDFDPKELAEIEKKLWAAEFKRKQFAPVLRLSPRAFGIGRRYPITKRIPDFDLT